MNKHVRKAYRFLASNIIVASKHNNIVIENYRSSICKTCKYYDQDNIQCKKCGCLLDVKWKSLTNRSKDKIVLTHCPAGKWNDQDIAEFYSKKSKS